ncbi:hypothetical protein P8868_16430 [Bacillus inaquosorum]|uniref:hypothetical protein n=1 Tax=Bacillus inaquosorum TaxID=483913 RepID=UPI00228196D1|nr:hypothetical protein [Bacillus inaquosorum]MCY8374107.1 hypothetical protein [Bacillus inaquosorum]MEC0559150.1 hypothetical protein [Bacillus inaquosorum]
MKKFKHRIKGVKHTLIRGKNYIDLKIRFPLYKWMMFIFKTLEIIILLTYIGLILQLTKVVNFDFLQKILSYIPVTNSEINTRLVIAQISITFLILSLFSLISNIKKEKMLGTSIYSVAFSNSVISNILLLTPFIFVLLFINLYLMMTKSNSGSIVFLFLSSMIAITILILKVITYTNFKQLTRNKIITLYYLENRKIIKKYAKKSFDPTYELSNNLFELVNDTVERIWRDDIEYKMNLMVFEKITDLSLKNYGKEIQENHTEMLNKPDIISLWSNCISELVKKTKISEALDQYNRMLSLFIKNEIVISSYEIGNHFKEIMDLITISKDEITSTQYKEIKRAMELSMEYCFLLLNNDLSYTRIGKLRNGLLSVRGVYGRFFVDYYKILNKKSDLSSSKHYYSNIIIEYFEDIRTMSIDLHFRHHYFIAQKTNSILNIVAEDIRSQYDGELSLSGIPLSALLIELIKEEKKGRLMYFLIDFNNKSIYFACLIVAGKLTDLLRSTNKIDELEKVKYYLKFILAKLLEWNYNNLKYNIHIIKESLLKTLNSPYSDIWLSEKQFEDIKRVKNVVEMKRHKVDIPIMQIKDSAIRELFILMKDINVSTLKNEARGEQLKITKEKGILHRLR